MGDAFLALGDERSAVASWHEAYAVESGRREPFIRLAEHAMRKQDWPRAEAYASAALTIPQSGFYADDASNYREKPHEILYTALWYQGKPEAHDHFRKCLGYLPNHPKYLHDRQFFPLPEGVSPVLDRRMGSWELPTVSILVPTLGRPEGLKRCLDSIEILNYPKNLIEVWFREDEPRLGVPKRVRQGVEETRGEYLVFAANDTEFEPDTVLRAVMASRKEKKRLVAFNTGELYPDKGNICEHFLIKRDLLPEIGGDIFDTEFHHVGVDNLLWAKCEVLGEATRCEEAKLKHHHFTRSPVKMDEVYELGYSKADQDRQLLKNKLAKLLSGMSPALV